MRDTISHEDLQGQYHFVFILAPERTKRFAAFIVGWTTVLGWWIITCSGVTLASVSVLGLANFWNPGFVATQWQIYLMYLLMILISCKYLEIRNCQ